MIRANGVQLRSVKVFHFYVCNLFVAVLRTRFMMEIFDSMCPEIISETGLRSYEFNFNNARENVVTDF